VEDAMSESGIEVQRPELKPQSWYVPPVHKIPPVSEEDMRELRDRALSHACYISPEMSAFDGDDPEYLARLLKTADRLADWIKDGL
jgi:hypothetical protein